MSDVTASLDREELLHVAIEAARRNEHAVALSYLKRGVVRFPDYAPISYMLGAEYAQMELYDRAEEYMERAVALDPNLHTARFQLGLLQLTQARLEDARRTWAALAALPEEHALHLYTAGLEALATDQFGRARGLIEQGLSADGGSPELTRDMTNLLERIPPDNGEQAPRGTEGGGDADDSEHLLVNAYRRPEQLN